MTADNPKGILASLERIDTNKPPHSPSSSSSTTPSAGSAASEDSLHTGLNKAQLRETSHVYFDQLQFSKELHKRELDELEAGHGAELEKVKDTLLVAEARIIEQDIQKKRLQAAMRASYHM